MSQTGADGTHAAVFQQFAALGQADESLATGDLTCRELRDALWLAQRLGRTDEPPTTDSPVRTPGPRATAEPSVQPPADPEPPEPTGPEAEPGSDTTSAAHDEWTPTPVNPMLTGPGHGSDVGRGAGLTWPTVPALPQARQIARALRPFTRAAPSPWRLELDEEATAIRAAQDDLWLPRWKAADWRPFDVALVVDSNPSMEIWQDTVREFRALLQRQGAFRDVRGYLLDSSGSTAEDPPLRAEGAARRNRHWSHLVNPNGKRIVLVLTDAIGAAWRTGTAARLLHRWGQRMPTAVVHTLAQRLWSWGGLGPRRIRLSAPAPGAPNKRLRIAATEPDLAAGGGNTGAIAVPVLGLASDWFSDWARLVTAPGAEWVETTAVLVHANAEPAPPPAATRDQLTPHARVLRFRTFASVQAFQLACLLAATPLNLSTMKLVQRVLLPHTGLSVLAEVMLGDLLKRLPSTKSRTGRADAVYEYHDGVREELLAAGQRADTIRVARMLSSYTSHENAAMRNFGAALDAPDDTEELRPSPENLPFLRLQEAVFRALAGPYTQRARRLRELRVGSPPDSTAPVETETPDRRFSVERPNPMGRPPIWGSVPRRNSDFVGRRGLLEQLRRRLLEPGATAVLPEALHGMGGVGKSQTVVEYVHQHRSDYDVVWWISAEHQSQITASFVELAKKLGVPAAASAETAVPAVLEALREGNPYSRWILIFDNADRPDLVRPYFPVGSGHIVVTSRNSEWGGFARAVEVNLFTRAESVELLHRRGGELTEADADRLAEALGDLPLAIEQGAAWRAQTGMQVSEYVALLEENRRELLDAHNPVDYQLPVAVAWNVPLKLLEREHLAALQLLQVCAFFGPEPISQALFEGVRSAPVPDELADALGDPIELGRAIRRIDRYRLAKVDHSTETLQLHRLVQSVLKNRLTESEQRDLRHAVHILLVNGDPRAPLLVRNWARYRQLLPHAVASNAVRCQDKWVRVLTMNLVKYLQSSGDYDGARDLSEQAMRAWRTTIGETALDTLEMSRRHAIALRRLGRVEEARLLNEKTYATLLDTFGENHESILSMLDTVAADRRSQGLFAEELELQRTVYERSLEIRGENDPDTLTYANSLASCHRLMGEFVKARELDEDTLRRRTEVLGPDHLLTYGSLNALAMDLRECGLHAEACQLQEDNLREQKEIFGEDHPSTIGATRNLAVARRRAGDHAGAKELAEECLVRYRRRHGAKHLDTVTSLMSLSADLRHMGDLVGSLTMAQESYRLFAEIRGERHPFTLIAATNLAVTCRLAGDVERARELDDLAISALREVFDSDHPFTLVSATNLASDLAALGNHSAARMLDEDTLARSRRVLGSTHPSTLAVALNLSIDLADLGEMTTASILHGNAVAGFRQVLGDDHPATIAATRSARANCDTDTMQL